MPTLGVLVAAERLNGGELVDLARWIEAKGFDSLWLPELFGREPLATAGYLLGRTARIALATGIANVYVRDAHATAQARHALAELSGGRFMLGLGVSNVALDAARGHTWMAPVAKMTAYLDAMAKVKVDAPDPARAAPVYLAAHGPALQRLAAARADGIITYLMPPAHTRASRARVGARSTINAAAFFLAEQDAAIARAKARAALRPYIRLDYYQREWRKLGFRDEDFADGGSDRLVDALVAWGDDAALVRRVEAYAQSGADRVVVLPLALRTATGLDLRVLDVLMQRD